jgi:hypothetical protein
LTLAASSRTRPVRQTVVRWLMESSPRFHAKPRLD